MGLARLRGGILWWRVEVTWLDGAGKPAIARVPTSPAPVPRSYPGSPPGRSEVTDHVREAGGFLSSSVNGVSMYFWIHKMLRHYREADV